MTTNLFSPQNPKIRQHAKTRFYIDNELLSLYAKILKPHCIAVYCVLAKYANSKTQSCWPKYETIMDESGVGNRNTLRACLKKLEAENMIFVEWSPGNRSNIYILLDKSLWEIFNRIKSGTDTVTEMQNNNTRNEKPPYQNWSVDSTRTDTGNHTTKSDNKSHTNNSNNLNPSGAEAPGDNKENKGFDAAAKTRAYLEAKGIIRKKLTMDKKSTIKA